LVVAQERYNHYSLPEEEVRVNRRPRRSHLPLKGKVALIGLVFLTFCTGMLIAFYYSQVLITGYKTYTLGQQLATLRQETVSLEQEVDRLESLDRVEYVATNKLKMVQPGNKDVVVVKADFNGGKTVAGMAPGQGVPAEGDLEKVSVNGGRSRIVQAFASLMGIKGS
jgi:cell division protein FtsB